MKTDEFYNDLAEYYHLIYQDWEGSILRQAEMLDSIINEQWKDSETVLDVSCGIGTQSLGLAARGYSVTASDLSFGAVERARQEAEQRNLDIDFSAADMREAHIHHQKQFDIVISCDNSVPHLLTDGDILTAFRQMYECTRPGGGCIISVRDYEKEDLSIQQVKPYGIRQDGDTRWLIWQVWDPEPPLYTVSIYFVKDTGESKCETSVFRSLYYAVGIPVLMDLMEKAGFEDVYRQDDSFFQPVIIGMRT